MYEVTVGPTFQDASRAYQKHLVDWNEKIDRIVDLVMRTKMDTNTAEIVTAIIFAARNLKEAQGGKLNEKELVDSVMKWKARRRPPLDRDQIAYMVRVLAALDWINVEPSRDLLDFDSEPVPA